MSVKPWMAGARPGPREWYLQSQAGGRANGRVPLEIRSRDPFERSVREIRSRESERDPFERE
jgi:hypothetical protein